MKKKYFVVISIVVFVVFVSSVTFGKDPEEKLDYRIGVVEALVSQLQNQIEQLQLDLDATENDLIAAKDRISFLEADRIDHLARILDLEVWRDSTDLTLIALQQTDIGLGSNISYNGSDIDALQSGLGDLLLIFAGVTRNGNNIIFSGANLKVVNGTGNTHEINGLGNLIVGYNSTSHTGSHNIVCGFNNTYESYGGLVIGWGSGIAAPWASVTGGQRNQAIGVGSCISGGADNIALGNLSSISGGVHNTANGNSSSISGGYYNATDGIYSSVSGGYDRSVSGLYDWAAGDLSQDQ